MMDAKFCYVVQEVTCTESDVIGGSVKGVYSTLPMAQQAVKEFKKKYKKKHKDDMVLYEIIMKQLDELPMTNGDLEKTLEGLIQKGLMEPLIGEDGYFYYELTDLGKEVAKKLSKGGSWPHDLEDFYNENGGETGID
jgi:mRNA-degrading endonuclease YafQ of YafQ-DinJ toxin-antitoxin module